MTTRPSCFRPRMLCALILLFLQGGLIGCGRATTEEDHHEHGESWSVTAWGEDFEVFPEFEPLVQGAHSTAHVHVTRLEGFAPLTDGRVEVVLTNASGEQVFSADQPTRPGIYGIDLEPTSTGDFDLTFRLHADRGIAEVRGGKVRVGTSEQPGGVIVAPAPQGATDVGEPLSFLKEQQWKGEFGTEWVRSGKLARSVHGLARVRPPAGGEIVITAPVAGVLQASGSAGRWPFAGLRVARGAALFRLAPHVATDRSLPQLEAEEAALAADLATARARAARLETLLAAGATSQREVEESRARVAGLEARQAAAGRDLQAARSTRGGSSGGAGLILRAPFAGEIARVDTTPGSTVAAGDRLARLVRTDVLWFEILLSPADARKVAEGGVDGLILNDPEGDPLSIDDVRLVSVAPEVSSETGTVMVLLEGSPDAGAILGTTLDAQVLSAEAREGIVIPATSLVDDSGVSVVYLQLSGESFARQEVRVIERQGERLLVSGLTPGQRLVTRGGNAIRRSALMSQGGSHGHVH